MAGSTRPRSIATISRSGRCLRGILPASPATCWRPAVALASMSSPSPAKPPISPWWPSDLSTQHLASIAAWRAQAGLSNIRPPLRIDLSDPDWFSAGGGPGKLLAIFCANVIHIAPWRVAEGLFAGAARHLRDDGRLFLYGPFKRDGKHTALSNAVFDTSLREGNPEWGVRDIADLEKLASSAGL